MDRLKIVQRICGQFQIFGDLLHTEPLRLGHINETWIATYNQGGQQVRYIHQRINQHVFNDPVAVMQNLMRVTSHIRSKLAAQGVDDLTRRSLIVIPTHDGRPCYEDGEGNYWRTFVFIEGTQSLRAVQSRPQAFEAGRAFGEFQFQLVDLPGERLRETIPDFHHSRRRFEAFKKAVTEDTHHRACRARTEIGFALKRSAICDVLLSAMATGTIPERITHNDAKFNNVLLDQQTGKALCVIDLDTVMPGCALYDFGDLVRSATSPAPEDGRDLSKIKMRMPLFKQLTQGYLSAAGGFLNRTERSLLAFSGKLITFETGLRFLTDYLSGDRYFRVHRPRHNLDRCRAQFRLVESIEQHEDAMQKWVDQLG